MARFIVEPPITGEVKTEALKEAYGLRGGKPFLKERKVGSFKRSE